MASGQCLPGYLRFQTLSIRVYFFQMTNGMTCSVRTMPATAYAFQTAIARVFALPDAECQGIFLPDNECHDMSRDDTCQVTYLLDNKPRYVGSGRQLPRHLHSGRRVSGYFLFQTQSVRAYFSQTTNVMTCGVRTMPATAYALRTASARA